MSDSDLSARLPGPVTGRPRRPLSNSASTASWSIRFSLLTMISGAPRSSSRLRRLLRLITRRYRSFRSEVAKRPPSSCTIGRRSGGITGTQSSTMPMGELVVDRNALTTLRRLRARVFFWPLPVAMVSRSEAASASRSKVSRRFCSAAAPIPPSKYMPKRRRISRYSCSSPSRSWTLRFLKRSQTASSLSSSWVARRRICDISRSAPSRTLRRTSALAPSASSSARSPSRRLARSSISRVTTTLDLGLLVEDARLQARQVAVARLVVDGGDHVGGEVDDLLEVLRGQVQQVAQPARDALEVPDVGDGRGELDVAHPLTTHLGAGHLDAAALADDALEADALVLAAVALPVPGGTEDLLAEEPVLLRLQGAVVDGLGLLDLAVRPRADVVGGGQADAELVEEVDVEHRFLLSLRFSRSWRGAGAGRPAWLPRGPAAQAPRSLVRPLRRCSARAGTGRCRAPPPRGRRRRRSPASRSTCRRWTAPRR